MQFVDGREGPREQRRIADIVALVPEGLASALDAGARDGYISLKLAERVSAVTAVDLEVPAPPPPGINFVRADITRLAFADGSFDLVFCSEVLEHIGPEQLVRACAELHRVSSRYIVIGVPYRQDLRLGQTTCSECGAVIPPWGHLSSFDEDRLAALFTGCRVVRTSFVGHEREWTNATSAWLMNAAGNPYGTYEQLERCIHCAGSLGTPPPRDLPAKILTKLAVWTQRAQHLFTRPRPLWIHLLLEKLPARG